MTMVEQTTRKTYVTVLTVSTDHQKNNNTNMKELHTGRGQNQKLAEEKVNDEWNKSSN